MTDRVVSASGTAASSLHSKGLAKAIEAAMHAATLKALADGIIDPSEVRARKLAARAAAKAAFAAG